ncbi:MAG: glycyl-radical enzyme activating protein [Bacteroidales bacterium]|nr:glycyl-radical enzyme activating protein [Bacteroidales bacterium]MCF8334212.1 glycyl-radical enzyme activating protein [Bacteroidales bacterium]
MNGVLFDIKRFAVHDGPGIRTTFFLKGCPMNCLWCHNPEGRIMEPETNPQNGKAIGKHYSAKQLLTEAEKDRMFFEESDGGITFSGGEPLLQYDFMYETLQLLKPQGYHVVIDTTGYAAPAKLISIARKVDLALFDVKHMDAVLHKKYTGVSNRLVLENLTMLDEHGVDLRIRFPLIPGVNNDSENLGQMIGFLKKLKRHYPVDILPYHRIAGHKYDKFKLENRMQEAPEPSEEEIQNTQRFFTEAGFSATIGG